MIIAASFFLSYYPRTKFAATTPVELNATLRATYAPSVLYDISNHLSKASNIVLKSASALLKSASTLCKLHNIIIVLAAVSSVTASPGSYWDRTSDAVVDIAFSFRNEITPDTNLTEYCGDKSSGQNMWFTENQCSIASVDMTYIIKDTTIIKDAKKGEVIALDCEAIECPKPKVPDCYVYPGQCEPDEWCMLNQQQVWIAGGAGGGSPFGVKPFCEEFFKDSTISGTAEAYYQFKKSQDGFDDITELQAQNIWNSAKFSCGGIDGKAHGITWVQSLDPTTNVDYAKGSRGRCVKYRAESQSCIPRLTGGLEYALPKMESGKQFKRPLLCDPNKNLQCTGPEFEPLPSTCVTERPKDICYLGPWWNSTSCPRSETPIEGGLDYYTLLKSVKSFLLLFPSDSSHPSICEFWDRDTGLGNAAWEARKDGYSIIKDLWPAHLGGKFASPGLPAFDEWESGFEITKGEYSSCYF